MKETLDPDISASLFGPEKISIGWSVETLSIYVNRIMEEKDRRYQDRFGAQSDSIRVAYDSAQKAIGLASKLAESGLAHAQTIINERDRTYQQRWEAQQSALNAALSAAEKAVQAAFVSQEKAVAAALQAAERAVSKAEVSSEKRFDATNEFRAQLTDQAATFITRLEFDRVVQSINDKLGATQLLMLDKFDAQGKHFMDRIDDLNKYRDISIGSSKGMNQGWGYLVGGLGVASAIVSMIMTLLLRTK